MSALIDQLLDRLQAAAGDTAEIEVKSAAGGLPASVTESLSALANLPGGGYLILGVSEADGFTAVGLRDPQILKQGLATKARSYLPPVRLTFDDHAAVDGQPVVLATVHECDPADKPCRVASTGVAYGRSYDGDHALSDIEIQAFLLNRTAPVSDREPIPGSSVDDLDAALVATWRERLAEIGDSLSRFDGVEQLRHAGVVATNGELTKAGLLVLGSYPQQFLPRFVINVADFRDTGGSTRARNARSITGPIPLMLADTLDWLRTNLATVTTETGDGSVIDAPEYPLEALREVVANALVHRDISDWSHGRAIELRLLPDRFIITNPGGLYGITVDRLGSDKVTSARNGFLVALCVNARNPKDRARVIEALATGLTRVTSALAARRLPPASYHDYGLEFTVVIRRATNAAVPLRHTPYRVTTPIPAPRPTGTSLVRSRIAEVLSDGASLSVAQIAEATQVNVGTVRNALTRMRKDGLVQLLGGPGKASLYRLVSRSD